MIVVVERTGNYHLAPKRAFGKAGFDTRVVHPFATKQYRMPADPGNKTDGTDLNAQHRPAVAGFGLCEFELASPYRTGLPIDPSKTTEKPPADWGEERTPSETFSLRT